MNFLDRLSLLKLPEISKGLFYLLDLTQIDLTEVEQAKSLLHASILKRADRFHLKDDQKRYLLTHAALRFLLSKWAQKDPEDIVLLKDLMGKPYLDNRPIHFNISHTKKYAFFGFHPNLEIGVDIEEKRDLSDFYEVSKSFMHPKEQVVLKNHSNPLEFFYALWSAKEAYLKATGLSFDQLSDLNLVLDFQLPDQLKVVDPSIKIFTSLDRVKEHSLSVCISKK